MCHNCGSAISRKRGDLHNQLSWLPSPSEAIWGSDGDGSQDRRVLAPQSPSSTPGNGRRPAGAPRLARPVP